MVFSIRGVLCRPIGPVYWTVDHRWCHVATVILSFQHPCQQVHVLPEHVPPAGLASHKCLSSCSHLPQQGWSPRRRRRGQTFSRCLLSLRHPRSILPLAPEVFERTTSDRTNPNKES
jgi:hypothetical protein